MQSVFFFLLALPIEAYSLGGDNSPVTRVVKLLQEMLENSKEDGQADRTAFAKFKCYCDTNTEEKTKQIANATGEIERMESTIAKSRATNAKLSSEVFELDQAMDDNQAARSEATNNRNKENVQFLSDESDMETGIAQLDRAIKMLAAVGADATEPNEMTNADNTAAMQGQGALAMKFLQKPGSFDDETKQALRAASVFLTSAQRKAVTSFLQAPGNYNAQSGEITGILKNMNDTFTANLETARDEETKARQAYNSYSEEALTEFREQKTSKFSKKDQIGELAGEIATLDSQRKTKERELANSQDFLAKLTERCDSKRAEFEKRNMLRSNEEAAIAQAIAILNSDGAFEVFSNTGVKAGGMGGVFLQTSSVIHRKSALTAQRVLRAKVIKSLLATAKQTKSLRLARTIASLAATNPFEAVVKQIRDVITLIDKEAEADQNKKDWCDTEQSEHNSNKADQTADIGTLSTNIGNLQIAVDESTTNIEQAEEDTGSNRDAQASETSARKEAHTNFQASLKNLQDAQSILQKAIEVLTKYYDFLHKSTAAHTYNRHSGKDSGGSNLEQIGGNPTVADLSKACSTRPDCAGFNTAGWLKSAIADEVEWYDWDGGDLYVKDFEDGALGGRFDFAQTDAKPDKGPKLSRGGEGGNRAISMLEFIRDETKDEADLAMTTEKTNQMQYETNMEALTTAEQALQDAIGGYKVDLATGAKRLEQANQDKTATQAELDSTQSYLRVIEPGCTYIQSNIGARQSAQAAEKSALQGAIQTLESSPAYTNYADSQESEDLGKCSDICNGKEDTMTAECQACINAVTVFGYCSQADNASQVSGCDDPTATGSADAMDAPDKKKK